ncbi:hypothetical protein IGI37_001102 [Enterococcus sp. AZ194]|uniref:helix-turn-helix domain-containing protein n=1 Tax=Enterococcus sp. AZ194 TaxID=2774629 RepID=UPI003F2528AB
MILDILEEQDKYVLLLAKLLEQHNNELLTDAHICETLGISRFRMEHYLEELGHVLSEKEVSFNKKGEALYRKLTMGDIECLKNVLVTRSKKFKLLHYIIEGNSSIRKFARDEFLSLSQAYRKRRELNTFFEEEFGLVIDGMKIRGGSELHIRNTLLTIYFFYCSGFPSPFSKKIRTYAMNIEGFLLTNLALRLTRTSREKLELFLCLHYSRVHTDNVLNSEESGYIQSIALIETSYFEELNHYVAKEVSDTKELYFLDTFLFFNIFKTGMPLQLGEISTQLMDQFATIFTKYIKNKTLFSDEIKQKLALLISNWFIFTSEATSFIDEFQINYFSEMYPAFHAIAFDFVDTTCRHLQNRQVSNTQLVKYYYDLIFMLIETVPITEIEQPIKVCIDFSHGESYNSFIEKNILFYKDLNIEVQRYNDMNTDLYLTDNFQSTLRAKQIVWRDPPTPNDWSYFADVVLELKRDKLEKE